MSGVKAPRALPLGLRSRLLGLLGRARLTRILAVLMGLEVAAAFKLIANSP